MQQWIGCDAHKKFSVFVAVDERGKASHAVRVEHQAGGPRYSNVLILTDSRHDELHMRSEPLCYTEGASASIFEGGLAFPVRISST